MKKKLKDGKKLLWELLINRLEKTIDDTFIQVGAVLTNPSEKGRKGVRLGAHLAKSFLEQKLGTFWWNHFKSALKWWIVLDDVSNLSWMALFIHFLKTSDRHLLCNRIFDCQRDTDPLKDELQNYATNGPHISGKKFNLDGFYLKQTR